ncbi:hypothetical protein [Amycolatopsis sp. cg9]|uniref:hypothetical protein n=1 Tax=Amycolatopsis sp. cg9 TaxID=3238801 RepID=UPI003524A942
MTRFSWIGPGELVLLAVLRTGRFGIEAALLSVVFLVAACASATSVRLGLRAAIDLVARLVLLPPHTWTAAVVVLDAVVIAGAWFVAGRRSR